MHRTLINEIYVFPSLNHQKPKEPIGRLVKDKEVV